MVKICDTTDHLRDTTLGRSHKVKTTDITGYLQFSL
jgi:hypothetical protein